MNFRRLKTEKMLTVTHEKPRNVHRLAETIQRTCNQLFSKESKFRRCQQKL